MVILHPSQIMGLIVRVENSIKLCLVRLNFLQPIPRGDYLRGCLMTRFPRFSKIVPKLIEVCHGLFRQHLGSVDSHQHGRLKEDVG